MLGRRAGSALGALTLLVAVLAITPASRADMNTVEVDGAPDGLVTLGSKVLFSATTAATGTEIWRSNGTPEGTKLVKDVNPGPEDSVHEFSFFASHLLTPVGSKVFFLANDQAHGSELWVTDGTKKGTILTRDIVPGPGSSIPQVVAFSGSTFWFTADDGVHGRELWRSKGTKKTTKMVTDLAPGSASSVMGDLSTDGRAIGKILYFGADDGTAEGTELWRTDGTSSGTSLVLDIAPGPASSSPGNFGAFNNQLLFNADDGTYGNEPWITDGTAGGTVLVEDIASGSDGSSPLFFTQLDPETALFRATGPNGNELFKTTGLAAGTSEVLDINPGTSGSNPSSFRLFNGDLYFAARQLTPTNIGTELWRSDGTPGGTELVMDISPEPAAGSSPGPFRVVGSTLYFEATTGFSGNGSELWKTDGVSAPVMVKDINVGSGGSGIHSLAALGDDRLLFDADDGTGSELWVSDGTAPGTTIVLNIGTGTKSFDPHELTPFGADLLFFADDGTGDDQQLWKVEPPDVASVLVTPGGPSPSLLRTDGTKAFFRSGTAIETQFINDENGALSPDEFFGIDTLMPFDGDVLFAGERFAGNGIEDLSDIGNELWLGDVTNATTTMVADINPTPGGSSNPRELVRLTGGVVMFTADDGTNDRQLWTTDGTGPNTTIVDPLPDLDPHELVPDSTGGLFFSGVGPFIGREPAYSDGNSTTIFNIAPSAMSSDPSGFTQINDGGDVVFAASGPSGRELYISDGTPGGTGLVLDINPGSASSAPTDLVRIGDDVYFAATTAKGTELWRTDGTTAGTVLVKNIAPEGASSSPHSFVEFENLVYFVATTSANGSELWRTDGTAAGTAIAHDLIAGKIGSGPREPTVAGTRLYFSAHDGTTGRELYYSDGSTVSRLAP